jgi:hypothetical protein
VLSVRCASQHELDVEVDLYIFACEAAYGDGRGAPREGAYAIQVHGAVERRTTRRVSGSGTVSTHDRRPPSLTKDMVQSPK